MVKDNQDVTFQKLIDKYLKDDPHLFIPQAFDNTCRNKSLSNDKLKALKDELGKDIVVQVEEADRRKPILLVGSNDALVKGTLALIWNTHPLIYDNKPKMGQSLLGYNNKDVERIFFLDKNCSGLSEEEIKRELFHKSELSDEEREEHFLNHECIELIKPLINVYKRGYVMLSLRGLEDKQHKNILKRLGVIKEGYRRDLINGVLIVGIDSTDTLPQEFKDQFEPIYLEPEKQDTAKQAKFIPFPTPSGTQWHEVKISFTDNENVKISARDKTENRHYSQMGFKHEQSVRYIRLWKTLRIFAMKDGIVTFQKMNIKKGETVSSTNEKLITQDDVKRLNKKLCICFGMKDKPITYDKENNAYKALFQIKEDTEVTKNFTNKPDDHDNDEKEGFFSRDSNDT